MKIGIDIDDCLATYMPVFLQRVNKHYGVEVNLDSLNKHSAKTEDYGYISVDQAKKLLGLDKKEKVLLKLPTHRDAVKAVNSLAKDHQIFLITSRDNYDHPLLEKHTRAWLKKQGFIFHHLEFTKNKGDAVKRLGVDVFIEDSLKFISQVIENGVKVIIFAQPWNKDYKEYLGQKLSKYIIERNNDWLQISNLVHQL